MEYFRRLISKKGQLISIFKVHQIKNKKFLAHNLWLFKNLLLLNSFKDTKETLTYLKKEQTKGIILEFNNKKDLTINLKKIETVYPNIEDHKDPILLLLHTQGTTNSLLISLTNLITNSNKTIEIIIEEDMEKGEAWSSTSYFLSSCLLYHLCWSKNVSKREETIKKRIDWPILNT